MMIFSDELLEQLRADPIEGTVRLIRTARLRFVAGNQEWHDEEYQDLLEAYALIIELADTGIVSIDRPDFEISGNMTNDCALIAQYLNALEKYCVSESSKLKVQSLRLHFKTALGSGFSYEFSQGDLDRVQVLINQIRDLIAQANGLEKDHQRRLLARLEKLQTELHKKVADLDRFWGLIGDAGVVLGKLGQDAKPIVDRVKEVAEIVWQTQSRAEELPSGTEIPMLTNTAAKDDKEV